GPRAIHCTDPSRARERSLFALYEVIEQGLEGTSMASYAGLPEADRWALSFHVGQYAFPAERVAQGRALWEGEPALRARFPDLAALTQVTPAALAAQLGQDEADALTAFLRRQPDAVAATAPPEGALALARLRVDEAAGAYRKGERKEARDLALPAYLDGFEPIEPVLAARDRALMLRIEAAMIELRTAIGSAAGAEDITAQAESIQALLLEAEQALAGGQANATSSFVGAFTILLREGLEALLIVIAMLAFLRKAGRTEAMPYVHAGWAGALLAGGATWAAATWLVGISGASRELTEGFAALFAAVVLVWVGIWMHGKSQAGACSATSRTSSRTRCRKARCGSCSCSPSWSSTARPSRRCCSMPPCGRRAPTARCWPAPPPRWWCWRWSPGRCCAGRAACRSAPSSRPAPFCWGYWRWCLPARAWPHCRRPAGSR